jgi:hypothetical protein
MHHIEPARLAPEIAPHRQGIQPSAAMRIEVRQALPAEAPAAGPYHRILEGLAAADAGAAVSMREQHGGRNFEGARLYVGVGQTVSIDYVGMPFAQAFNSAPETDFRDIPERSVRI